MCELMCVWYMCMYEGWKSEWGLKSPAWSLSILSLEIGSLTEPGTRGVASKSWSYCLHTHTRTLVHACARIHTHTRVIDICAAMLNFLHGWCGPELRFSCLGSEYSYTLNHLVTPNRVFQNTKIPMDYEGKETYLILENVKTVHKIL